MLPATSTIHDHLDRQQMPAIVRANSFDPAMPAEEKHG